MQALGCRVVLFVALVGCSVNARVWNYERDFGAIAFEPGNLSTAENVTAWSNGAALNASFQNLQPGDTLFVPNKTFHLMGGIIASDVSHVTIQIDGTFVYAFENTVEAAERYIRDWPRSTPGTMTKSGKVLECMHFRNFTDVTFTSSGVGTFEGRGQKWWGIPGLGYLKREENRPRLIKIDTNSKRILFENLYLHESPYWTLTASGISDLEIGNVHINNRRTNADGHGIIDMTAFNTDGFDVSGQRVWIHDCTVWNQDDCIAVKDGSNDMLFERIEASGIGLTIGSIGSSRNNNITFRDCHMHKTGKGIYMKFRSSGGVVSNVTYENIVFDQPQQWPIWIGPAQQSDSDNLCAPNGGCSICWPEESVCLGEKSVYADILLRNLTIISPKQSAGVILANETTPMRNVVFDGVRVTGVEPHGSKPWENVDYYVCKGVENGVARGDTYPVPKCFRDETSATQAQASRVSGAS